MGVARAGFSREKPVGEVYLMKGQRGGAGFCCQPVMNTEEAWFSQFSAQPAFLQWDDIWGVTPLVCRHGGCPPQLTQLVEAQLLRMIDESGKRPVRNRISDEGVGILFDGLDPMDPG